MRQATREGYHVDRGCLMLPASSAAGALTIPIRLTSPDSNGRICATCQHWQGSASKDREAPCELSPVSYLRGEGGEPIARWKTVNAGHHCPKHRPFTRSRL